MPSLLGNTGSTRQWRKRRAQILARDKGLCQDCKDTGRITIATEVDHIKSRAEGGDDSNDNLRSLCDVHHKAKTKAEVTGITPAGCDEKGYPIDMDVWEGGCKPL